MTSENTTTNTTATTLFSDNDDNTENNNNTNWCGIYISILNAHAQDTPGLNSDPALFELLSDHHNADNVSSSSSSFSSSSSSSSSSHALSLLPSLANCSGHSNHSVAPIVALAQALYTHSVPVILTIGLLGNMVSLRVFLSRSMRRLAATTYLVALSSADILALLFYVLVEWLRWGWPHLNDQQEPEFLNTAGVCQLLFYLSYVSRFLSAWFIVTFTVERYIGVCHPLKRKDICGNRSARKVLGSLVVFALVVMTFKPILTGPREFRTNDLKVSRCVPDPERPLLSFVLDSVYGLSITVIPFLIITVLNVLIIRKLLYRYKRHKRCHVVTEESIIRMEFTVILLVVSFVFIVLNLPYCFVWCKRFVLSQKDLHPHLLDSEDLGREFDHYEGVLMITRVIFYINYCVNFFLYSVTGAYFRKELKILVFYRSPDGRYLTCSRNGQSSPTSLRQSWL